MPAPKTKAQDNLSAFRVTDPAVHARARRAIKDAIEKQMGYGSLGRGNAFDDVLVQGLVNSLTPERSRNKAEFTYSATDKNGATGLLQFQMVTAEKWREDYPKMKEAVARAAKNAINRHGNIEIPADALPRSAERQADLLIVRQPNGSQLWPDVLIIVGGVGFPIEIKASSKDHVVWNGGLPRPNTLYVFNCATASGQSTTVFLGNEIADPDNIARLQAIQQDFLQKSLAHNNGILRDHKEKWKKTGQPPKNWPAPMLYYPRAMHTDSTEFFKSHTKREARERRALDHVLTAAFLRNDQQTQQELQQTQQELQQIQRELQQNPGQPPTVRPSGVTPNINHTPVVSLRTLNRAGRLHP